MLFGSTVDFLRAPDMVGRCAHRAPSRGQATDRSTRGQQLGMEASSRALRRRELRRPRQRDTGRSGNGTRQAAHGETSRTGDDSDGYGDGCFDLCRRRVVALRSGCRRICGRSSYLLNLTTSFREYGSLLRGRCTPRDVYRFRIGRRRKQNSQTATCQHCPQKEPLFG